VWLVDIATGEVVMLLSRPGAYEPIGKLAFSPDSTLLAVATSDLKLKILNTRSAETVHVLEGHADRITRVMFSPDGTFIVSGSWDGTVRVWGLP
jgi:WD40 repeat protein